MKIDLSCSTIHSNNNSESVKNKDSSVFEGSQYPSYIDIELDGIYELEKILVDTGDGFSFYSIFTSTDGVNFNLAGEKTDRASADTFLPLNAKAHTVRVYIKYNSVSNNGIIRSVELYGKRSNEKYTKHESVFPCSFSQSKYNVEISKDDTAEAVKGVIERTVGKEYTNWFLLELRDSETDFFELSDENGKIKITGNSGVSLCVGLNHYYKYFCHVSISQVGNQVKMPPEPVKIGGKIHRQTPFKIRYTYNYCALSYTMSFWDKEKWQKELDWLALCGANVILDITAMEEVWRRFLLRLGYSMRECLNFITGPSYYAWFNMANIYGVGGPVHESFFMKRTELARKNHLFMKKMGMMPVLQGYSGMVPSDINSKIPEACIIDQGKWNGLPRPAMLKTTTDTYKKLAELFYSCQNEVFGDCTNFFAADPFHEGGSSGEMSPSEVSRVMMECMLRNNKNSVWILQSWGENPSKELIEGIEDNKEHVLILDLYAEKRPRWKSFLGKEFMSTPWAYCMLNNFGGRMGLHGHIETVAKEVARAYKSAEFMSGIGITPEATLSNPVIFDLFFETAWGEKEPEEIQVEKWLCDYALRRYGGCSENMKESLSLLNSTVYNPLLNEAGEGAPESVINARPSLKIKSASSWGNGTVAYDKRDFEKAVRLFLQDIDKFRLSDGYRFDLVDLLKQVLSNTAQECHKKMAFAYENRDKKAFELYSKKFIETAEFTDKVLQNERTFTLRNWLEEADDFSENTDDFTKMLYRFNAKALITTWAGDRFSADEGGLRDYSNKQWSGLTKDLYLKRWKLFIEKCRKELNSESTEDIDYFFCDICFVWDKKDYTYYDNPCEDLKATGERVLSKFSVDSL